MVGPPVTKLFSRPPSPPKVQIHGAGSVINILFFSSQEDHAKSYILASVCLPPTSNINIFGPFYTNHVPHTSIQVERIVPLLPTETTNWEEFACFTNKTRNFRGK